MTRSQAADAVVSSLADEPTSTEPRLRLTSFAAAEGLRAARQLLTEAGIEVTAQTLSSWCDERIARPGFPADKVRALVELRDAIAAAAAEPRAGARAILRAHVIRGAGIIRGSTARSRATTVRDLEAATWRPEAASGAPADHPDPSQARIAESRAVTARLPLTR